MQTNEVEIPVIGYRFEATPFRRLSCTFTESTITTEPRSNSAGFSKPRAKAPIVADFHSRRASFFSPYLHSVTCERTHNAVRDVLILNIRQSILQGFRLILRPEQPTRQENSTREIGVQALSRLLVTDLRDFTRLSVH